MQSRLIFKDGRVVMVESMSRDQSFKTADQRGEKIDAKWQPPKKDAKGFISNPKFNGKGRGNNYFMVSIEGGQFQPMQSMKLRKALNVESYELMFGKNRK